MILSVVDLFIETDIITDSSAQYLVVTLGTARQSTHSISKTLNPEWKVCLDLPIGEVPLVECVCWDRDRFGKDYLGEFDIAVEDIFANGRPTQEVGSTPLLRRLDPY